MQTDEYSPESRRCACRSTSLLVLAAAAAGCGLGAKTGCAAETTPYQGPRTVLAAPDGASLYVACADAHRVVWVELPGGHIQRRVAMPAQPTGLALSPDGSKLIVTCAAPSSCIQILDAMSGELLTTVSAGHTAMSPVVSPDGERLYVCNRFDNDVSVIDLPSCQQVARVDAEREPVAAAITPNGEFLLVANHLPNRPTAKASDGKVCPTVTLINTCTHERCALKLPHGANGLRDVCVAPDGKHAFVTHLLSNFEMVPFRVDTGWINVNVVSIIDIQQRKVIRTIGMDDYYNGAGNPHDVMFSADGKKVCISLAGTHEIVRD